MRLITWNVRGVVSSSIVDQQLDELATRQPDLVALQDVHPRAVPQYETALAAAGLTSMVSSVGLSSVPPVDRPVRFRGVMLASRFPLTELPTTGLGGRLVLPWPERSLSANVQAPGGMIELHTLYLPNPLGRTRAETDARRAAWLASREALYEYIVRPAPPRRIVCGDFNAVKLNTLAELQAFDLHDVHALLDPSRVDEPSWYDPRGKVAYRLDYVLASKTLQPRASRYLHNVARRGASDHAPQEVDFGVDGATDAHPRRPGAGMAKRLTAHIRRRLLRGQRAT